MSPYVLPAVLHCDSDALTLSAFERSFGQRFRIVRCSSPNEALAQLVQRRGEIGVVISDLRFPGMNGVELLERARVLAPDIKRMILTTPVDMHVVVEALQRGQITRYFLKPWDRAELLAALEDALKIARLEMKLREMESHRVEAEHRVMPRQVMVGISHALEGPLGSIAPSVRAMRKNIARVVEYVNKHLAWDNHRDVAEIVKDLPVFIEELQMGAEHMRKVAQGLKARRHGGELAQAAEVSEVVFFAVKLAQAQVRERAELTRSGEPVRVVFGPVSLCLVLLNLIINAAQAMEGIGRQGRIDVKWAVEEHDVVLTVSDNGCGIPQELQEKVFQPPLIPRPVGSDVGLGLPICKALVTQYGGTLELSSVPGEGTHVQLRLRPASSSASGAPAAG